MDFAESEQFLTKSFLEPYGKDEFRETKSASIIVIFKDLEETEIFLFLLTIMNKKAFKQDAHRPLANRMCFGGHQMSVLVRGVPMSHDMVQKISTS